MTTFAKKLLLLILIIIFGSIYLYFFFSKEEPQPIVQEQNLPETIEPTKKFIGCYIATLNKDVYTLNIEKEENFDLSGTLSYKNFEKDSSSGAFKGNIKDDILLGVYSFDSEGMHSESEVIFKYIDGNFVQGFGPVKTKDGKQVFEDITKVTYDGKSTFIKKDSCL